MEPESTDGYSAWISIDNVKLPQYGGEVVVAASGKKEVTYWIVSEKFSVQWILPPCQERLTGRIWIDGNVMTNTSKPGRPMPITVAKSCKRISETSARPFVFSGRELTDDDAHLNEMQKNLGDIKLEIWVSTLNPHSRPRGYLKPQLSTKTHERSNKAMISHQATLGEEYNITTHTTTTSTRISLVISFVFKYRPRGFLQAEGIIPPDPIPDAGPRRRVAETPEPSDSEDDHEEELERQRERLQIRKEELQLRKEELELQTKLALIKAKRKKKAKLNPQIADRA